MPELPEVETIVRRLRSELIGLKISKIRVLTPKILRLPKEVFIPALTGAIIREIRRKGKLILMDLGLGRTLVIHLKMTGQVLLTSKPTTADRHTHVIFDFSPPGIQMHYRDIRKFGFFDLIQGDPTDRAHYVDRVGPDPFEITAPQFTRLVLSKNKAVKSLLLDQSLISGLGNIYVDESLFQAKIHPLTKAGDISAARIKNLHRVIRSVLSRAILKKGSTLKDYRRPDGSSGGFQNYHQVYGRTGQACPFCQSPVQKIRVGGRGTHFCPGCQKL
jgi:formamidopyrimidine-DNA glycosylase